MRETALDAARRGLARYDFPGQDAAYKMKWTDLRAGRTSRYVIDAPSLRGRARRRAREVARPLAGRARRTLRTLVDTDIVRRRRSPRRKGTGREKAESGPDAVTRFVDCSSGGTMTILQYEPSDGENSPPY